MFGKLISYFRVNNGHQLEVDFLTVVLLTFNRRDYVKISLAAILRQTYSNFRIIVIDNHSTDGTLDLVNDLIADDERVTYIRLNKASNAGNSFVTGVLAARSEYVLVTHDDDILDDDYIENIINVCKDRSDVGLLAANARIIDEQGGLINDRLYGLREDVYFNKYEYLDYYLINRLWLPTPSLCFRKEYYLKFIGFDNYTYRSIGDYVCRRVEQFSYRPSLDIFYNIFLNQYDGIYFFSEPKFSHRQHPGQESRGVNQSRPMLELVDEINKAGFKLKNKESLKNVEDKYKIQDLLFSNRFQELGEYLDSSPATLHVCISSNLFFNKKITYSQMSASMEDPYYRLYELMYFDRYKANLDKFIDKQVVIVGSMLCAFYIEQILIQKDCRVAAVLDLAPARQGCDLIYNKIIAYEDFLYSDLGRYIFIITSERINDLSIASTIMEHFPGANYLFWQSLFDD